MTRRGSWWVSECDRWRVSMIRVFHGTSYTAYDWYPGGDEWAPKQLGVRFTLDEAKSLTPCNDSSAQAGDADWDLRSPPP